MAKLGIVERTELKGAMCRIIHIVLEIETKIQPSLQDRLGELQKREKYTDRDVQALYDQYIEDVAEEYIQRIEK